MSIIKKMWIVLFWIITIFTLNFGYCGLDDWTTPSSWDTVIDITDPQVGTTTVEDPDDWAQLFTRKLKWILWLDKPNNYETKLWYIIALIQIAVNWLLWILAFVALVYMLYCGFLVFSSGADDKNATKGKKWISTAAIALAWIGLSWLIISAMIRFIRLISNSGN